MALLFKMRLKSWDCSLLILADNTITEDVAEKIFIELIEFFPTTMGKREFSQILLGVAMKIIEIGDQSL